MSTIFNYSDLKDVVSKESSMLPGYKSRVSNVDVIIAKPSSVTNDLYDGMVVKLVNGKVVFTTTHLSTYGVIGYNNPTTNPETSDNIVTYAVILCASIFALGSAVTLRKRYN